MISFADCCLLLPSIIMIDHIGYKRDFPSLTSLSSFFLAVNKDKPNNKKLLVLRDHLKTNAHKCACFRHETQHFIIEPQSYPNMDKYEYTHGFTCFMLPKKSSTVSIAAPIQPIFAPIQVQPIAVPIAAPIAISVAPIPIQIHAMPLYKGSITDPGNNAEQHYNSLKRDVASRHLSCIYHLRAYNNFIKAELIYLATQIVCNSSSDSSASEGKATASPVLITYSPPPIHYPAPCTLHPAPCTLPSKA